MADLEFTVLCPFGGSGGGALGFLEAEVRLLGNVGRFRCLGSVDFDREACEDFERFTGSVAWCTDIEQLTGAAVRERFGARRPDCVFLSPPCKGSSRLLPKKKAASKKYKRMNRLAVVWTIAMLEAWGDDPPPLVLVENVPGLPRRAKAMLCSMRSLLRSAGYVFHEGTHDCGEIGGLAQHRQRFLMVARRPRVCPPILYQPPKRRVRGCGEVLEALPMPATLAAAAWGSLHEMPRITWRNWLRLALIPAGGDWRDLEGVLAEGQARREVFARHRVEGWTDPTGAVSGSGSNGPANVADPRIAPPKGPKWAKYHVADPDEPSRTVIAGRDNGAYGISDARVADLACSPRAGNWNTYGVLRGDDPAGTVAGESSPSNGRYSVADPRAAVLRVGRAYDAGYGVLGWSDPARTVAGTTAVGCGAYSVAEPRRQLVEGARVLALDEALELDLDVAKRPPFIPLIIAADGTWHRPLTLLELAMLQGYPADIAGGPIHFAGNRTQRAEHIGNSVPPPAARAIADQMLVALVQAELEAFALSAGEVWVDPVEREQALHG